MNSVVELNKTSIFAFDRNHDVRELNSLTWDIDKQTLGVNKNIDNLHS